MRILHLHSRVYSAGDGRLEKLSICPPSSLRLVAVFTVDYPSSWPSDKLYLKLAIIAIVARQLGKNTMWSTGTQLFCVMVIAVIVTMF